MRKKVCENCGQPWSLHQIEHIKADEKIIKVVWVCPELKGRADAEVQA